jgi:transcriptional regulator with XRE-family HTH domain
MSDNQSHPGSLVREARTLAGIGLNDFSVSVGVQPATLSMFERGQSRLSLELHLKVLKGLVERLAQRYGLEADDALFTVARAENEIRRLTVLAEAVRLETAIDGLTVQTSA